MIKVKNLHKKFGGLTVLNGIDEHISQGEVVVVIVAIRFRQKYILKMSESARGCDRRGNLCG